MHPIICFYVRQLLHYLLRQNLLFYPAQILNINSLTFYIPYSISRAAKWLCPNLSFFFFPFQSDGSGRSRGTISGGDTVCSPPHLHHVIESAKIVFVILGKGACFKATQGLLKWALVSCMISFRGQERSRTDSSGWEGWLMRFLNFHEKQREVVRPKLCSSCGRKKAPNLKKYKAHRETTERPPI